MVAVHGKVAAQIAMSLAAVDSEEEPALMEKVGAERVPTLVTRGVITRQPAAR